MTPQNSGIASNTSPSDPTRLHPIRIIVAGSRPPKGLDPLIAKALLDDYKQLIFNHLDGLLINCNPQDVAIISGMAAGADMIGHEYARERGLAVIEMPADWKTHQKRAGYLRNEAMANIATHAAIYYDGQSKGSNHMIQLAQKKGLNLRVESKATPALFERYTQPPLDRSTELPPQVIPPPDDKEYETAERTQSVTDDLHIESLDAVQPKAAPVLEDEALETPQQEDTESSLDLPEPDEKVESVTQALTEAAKEEVAITTQMGKGSEVTEEAAKEKGEALASTTNTEGAVAGNKPEPPKLLPVTAFSPSTASLDQLEDAISNPSNYRILEQMKNVVLDVQEGVEQLPNAVALPLEITKAVGDEIPVVFLDLETTGFDALSDHIIEVGLIRCMASPSTGQVTLIEKACSYLEDPNEPLSDTIIQVTGITDDMLKDQNIDDEKVADYFKDAPLVIAHNASFDRPFFENRFTQLQGLNWLCTIKQAPWNEKGFESNKLEYLALKSGFYYEGHRAAIDALAIVELLNRHEDVFPYMLEANKLAPVTFRALNAPFSAKDDLKAAGFRWDDGTASGIKAWYYEAALPAKDNEAAIEKYKAWMKTIYGPSADRCGVEVSETWQRFMSKDVLKSCTKAFKSDARTESQPSESSLNL